MLRIVLMSICVALLIAVLVSAKYIFQWIFSIGGPGFVDGFLFGMVLCFAVYGLICWVDPASRPRGRLGNKRPNDRV